VDAQLTNDHGSRLVKFLTTLVLILAPLWAPVIAGLLTMGMGRDQQNMFVLLACLAGVALAANELSSMGRKRRDHD